MSWEKLEKALDEETKNYPDARRILDFLRKDNQVNYLLEMANTVTVGRLKYNDHGKTHARIVALNSVRALQILKKKGIMPNFILENNFADFEDSIEIVLTASFLHDIGNSINRLNHEVWGMNLSREILNRLFDATEFAERKKVMIMEAILCHMGNYPPSCLEAKVVALADGCDMQKGRARLPYMKGKKDIHSMSALGVDKIRLESGTKKPIRIDIELNSSSGLFQIEEILIKKLRGVQFDGYVEIKAFIESRNETIYYLKD